MSAYLLPGRSVTGFCDLYSLGRATNLNVDGTYAHVAGGPAVRVKVDPDRLFAPLAVDQAA